MAESTIIAEFSAQTEKVWDLVTSLDNYSLRSDVDKIVVLKPREQFYRTLGRHFFFPGRKDNNSFYRKCNCKKNVYETICQKLLKKQQSVYIRDLKCALASDV